MSQGTIIITTALLSQWLMKKTHWSFSTLTITILSRATKLRWPSKTQEKCSQEAPWERDISIASLQKVKKRGRVIAAMCQIRSQIVCKSRFSNPSKSTNFHSRWKRLKHVIQRKWTSFRSNNQADNFLEHLSAAPKLDLSSLFKITPKSTYRDSPPPQL